VTRIFLSYRREDSGGQTGRLFDRLTAALGQERVFIDVELQPGTDYEDAIERTIESCDAVVVVIGPRWLESRDRAGARRLDDPHDLVRREVAAALQRPERTTIPVLVQGAAMPSRESLPEPLAALARRNALEISDSRFSFDAERLIAALREALKSAGDRPGAPPDARSKARSAGRARLARGLAVIAVAAALVVLLLFPGPLRHQQVVVPNVIGQPSASKAEEKLAAAKLKLDPEQEKRLDTKHPPGTIIGQTPNAGSKADKNAQVSVLVAIGTTKVNVPDITKMTASDAEKALRADGLRLGRASPQPIDPKGKIESQIPAANEVVKRGTPVDIFYPDPSEKRSGN
jgi:hypothetical protein